MRLIWTLLALSAFVGIGAGAWVVREEARFIAEEASAEKPDAELIAGAETGQIAGVFLMAICFATFWMSSMQARQECDRINRAAARKAAWRRFNSPEDN